MTPEGILVVVILVGIVALFVSEKYPLDIVAMLGLGVLLVLGLVTLQEGFSGFSNPATLTVACMFVLGAGVFDADDPAIDNVRRGYNLGPNYPFGALRVGTYLITTWPDVSWTGGPVKRATQGSLDSLSVDVEDAFQPGLRGYCNDVEVTHPEQLASWQAQSGQRESTWTIGVSVGF